MAEYRQPERCLGDENVAGHKLERHAGWIGDILVIARGDDAQPVAFDRYLRRTEHMAGGMDVDLCAAERNALAIAHRLRRAGEIDAIAKPHDVERFLRRQHRAVPGARVVGMAVGDDGLVHRLGRVDMKAAALAAHAGRRRQQ